MARPSSREFSIGSNRIYYYFVFGAAGGLTGWYLTGVLAVLSGNNSSLGFQILAGAILGSMIGLGTGAYDGVVSESLARFVKYGSNGLLLGLCAGAVALPLAQALYGSIRPGGPQAATPELFLKGVVCWVVFGGLIGLGEGFGQGSQTWMSMVGGIIGGAVGGGLYEAVGRSVTPESASSEQTLLACAVSALGGFIAYSVALVPTVLKDAWLTIESGKLTGTEINISRYVEKGMADKRPGIIGSQWDVPIYLPGDMRLLPQHARISYFDGSPMLTALPDAVEKGAIVRVNGRPVSTWRLGDGDRLQVGSTVLLYRHRRR
jgi:hypothetical protein